MSRCPVSEVAATGVARWHLVQVSVDSLRTVVPASDGAVQRYVQMRRGGQMFPPILLEYFNANGSSTPSDGHHRVRAAKVVGDEQIQAFIPA